MQGTLDGLLVIALEQAAAAPFCTARLADSGARVIKIERSDGDFARGYDDVVNGESSYFVWLNRGKESLCLNIKDEADNALLRRMISEADVFVQNLAPGAAARAGFDSEVLRLSNSRLITVDISGYGDDGPYRDMKAYDLLIQCESGLASVTGASSEPGRVGVSICDIACGMYAHAAVVEAILRRERTGQGQGISVSLFDALADWMTVPLLHQIGAGVAPPRVGLNHPSIAPYGAYATADDTQVVIAIQSEREWLQFCELVLQNKDIAVSPQFNSNVARCENREAMNVEINAIFSTLDRSDLIGRLQEASIAYGSVNSVEDLAAHPQLRMSPVETPSGEAKLVASPVRTTEGVSNYGSVPALGEHSESIRREFGA